MSIKKVTISRSAKKELRKVPVFIVRKLLTWVEAVELEGLEEVRKYMGYHDAPLLGKRRQQHSIRLSKSYRAIYSLFYQGGEDSITIEEASKHEY